MTPSEIATIARSLSKAQREAVLASEVMAGWPIELVAACLDPWPQGMCRYYSARRDQLTPIGLAVRAYLLENPDV